MKLSSFAASGLLLALAACSPKNAGNTSDGGEDPVDGGGYSYITPSNFCLELTKLYCDRMKRSGCMATGAEADCPTVLSGYLDCSFAGDIAGLVRAGLMTFDSSAVNACFSAEKDKKTCGFATDPSCKQMLVEVPGAAGGSCPATLWTGFCAAGNYCKPGSNVCLGTCTPNGGAGAFCNADAPCNDSNYCLSNGINSGSCQTITPTNGACTQFTDACGRHGYCKTAGGATTGTCQLRKPAGLSCTSQQECDSPTLCDTVTHTCVLERLQGVGGDTCNQYNTPLGCGQGFYCSGASASKLGHCAARLPSGSPCIASEDPCQDILFCNGATCVPLGDVAATCQGPGECLFGLMCWNFSCTRYPKLGQTCDPTRDRCLGSWCDPNTSLCAAPKGAGGACLATNECASQSCSATTSTCAAACTY